MSSLDQVQQVPLKASHKREPRGRVPTTSSRVTLPARHQQNSPRTIPAQKAVRAAAPARAVAKTCCEQADTENTLANAPSGGNKSLPPPATMLALDDMLEDSPPQASNQPTPLSSALLKSQNLLNQLNNLGLSSRGLNSLGLNSLGLRSMRGDTEEEVQ